MRGATVLMIAALAAPAAAAAQTAMSAMDYATAAGQSDAFEIASSHMAQSSAKSQVVKNFAAQMARDHTQSTKMVMAAAKSSQLTPPPPRPDSQQQQMLDQLTSQKGAAFDQLYVADQLQAHQMALALHTGYAQSGSDPNLKAAAVQIAPIVQMHLAMVQSMGGTQ